MSDKVQVNLRIPRETASALKEEAKRQKRSVNSLLEILVDEYLQKKQNNEIDLDS